MDIFSGLNTAQKEAVESISGPLLILAGPGSGKTRVITHRVAYLIKVCRISPYRIMAVTFTNKAAGQMRDRLNHLLGEPAVKSLTMGTFHAICARILRLDGKSIGIEPDFVIYDDDDQKDIIKRCVQELGLDPKQFVPAALSTAISAAKSSIVAAKDYPLYSKNYFQEVVKRVYERYEQLLADSKALDFDDLLLKAVLLFKKSPDILAKYQERYVHIMVDEFQDTNLVQYELIKLLARKHRNICVVGDPDQSIYSWRYADLRNIINFEKDFTDTKVVLLEQNYRSTKNILETAFNVISASKQRKPKGLWTENEPGEQATVFESYTEQEEAIFVVREIDCLVQRGEVKYGGCAVMYRTNAQSRALEEAFIRYGMPYKLVAGTRFYERREVKDVIAYLRLVQNPFDSVSLLRILNVPGRGIGQQTLMALSEWAKSQNITQFEALQKLAQAPSDGKNEFPFSSRVIKTLAGFGGIISELKTDSQHLNVVDLFDAVISKTGYKEYVLGEEDGDERWENVLELRTVAENFRELPPADGLSALLEGVALVSDVDGYNESTETVTLITLHQAKGLEFAVVFIVGVEEGLLPHFKSLEDPEQLEEERRLFYVGITRAKRKVYILRAFRRSLMGRSTVNKPSRFLQDIPANLVTSHASQDGKTDFNKQTEGKPCASPAAMLELKTGDRVRHSQFGDGIVVSSKAAKDDNEVVVAFAGIGVKKLLMSLAKLEKV